jgi:serine/threonine protein phosphatase 1
MNAILSRSLGVAPHRDDQEFDETMPFGFLNRKPFVPKLPDGVRAYAVGDIHGRLDLLSQLFEQIREDDAARGAADTQVVLLGDLIDRGPDSAGVVDLAMRPLDFAKLTVIQGNHEAMLVEALAGHREILLSWLRFGGRETLASWGVPEELIDGDDLDRLLAASVAAIPPDRRLWLATRPRALQLGDYYFVHAGIRPGVALHRQADQDRLWIRDPFLSSTSRHFAMIVHGHSISAEVELLPNRIGIDTGAYASGTLTALGLEGDGQWILQTG